jgi:hypothetical protein
LKQELQLLRDSSCHVTDIPRAQKFSIYLVNRDSVSLRETADQADISLMKNNKEQERQTSENTNVSRNHSLKNKIPESKRVARNHDNTKSLTKLKLLNCVASRDSCLGSSLSGLSIRDRRTCMIDNEMETRKERDLKTK